MARNIQLFVCVGALALSVATAAGVRGVHHPDPMQMAQQQQQPPAQQQPSEILLSIRGEPGAPPRYAVPDFIALDGDPETAAAARTIGQVLWDDLAFEREFYLIPRDTYATIPAARSLETVPFASWRELGTDGLVIGTVERSGNNFRVVMRLFDVRSGRSALAREYSGPISNPRVFAHTAADEIHQNQRGLRGIARTRLAFSSDRDGERVVGTVEARDVREIYISDYDGANQRRVTVNRKLNGFPQWAPDGRAIAFTSWMKGPQDIFVSRLYEGKLDNPTNARGHNWLPAWSPDGNWLCSRRTATARSSSTSCAGTVPRHAGSRTTLRPIRHRRGRRPGRT
jgi:TolB protein